MLTDRLNRLVEAGVLQRVRYNERPERFEYHLTEKGLELWVALLALMRQRGDRHLSEKPPAIARRRGDRSAVSVHIVAKDGSLSPDEVEFVPGPERRLRGLEELSELHPVAFSAHGARLERGFGRRRCRG